ncbi:unnamed protein product [Symbiodinium necroappetens]|uniref:Uncharacterized protein n=1 Tax=Symbiodinium necroappetens TaxID=1628268 RepID=A0A812N2B2_9DINO|nr:unnamed protein product [Symbiodinium necroappetens]|mmetsp:Transcript_49094/g.116938  ORF Transcript_49094/g.116938 Transcript_49094/m.116938 type:complete len:303 (+) Transcript_49094:98-1006(+)
MGSLQLLLSLWTVAFAIRHEDSQPSAFDPAQVAASLNEEFQKGTFSESLAQAGVVVRVFFESWVYVHGRSDGSDGSLNGVMEKVEAARSWDDVVSIHTRVMSATLLNIGMMQDHGLDLWPHGICGLVLNTTDYNDRWRCFYPADGCSDLRDGTGCGRHFWSYTGADRQKCTSFAKPSCDLAEWSAFRTWKCSGCPYHPTNLVDGLKMQIAWKDAVRACGSFNVTEHFHGLTYNELVLPYNPDSANQVTALFCRTVPDVFSSEQYRGIIAAAFKLRNLYEARFAKPIPVLAADFASPSPFSPL